ncbi:aromatic amino acid lyase [Leifsonia sp. AG29]|uniref:aromatic amino acid lyase n=1 Tax=Leifsonia sp. AG29 TaxID=2598860 RepID=UPI00131EBABE|nr:aromatic amino acid lyase [Leifsonia sp. AG29]
MTVRLGTQPLTAADIAAVADGAAVELGDGARAVIDASRAVVERAIATGEPVYGLNRRLGAGRDDAVDPEEFHAFQTRTIANHRGGIGEVLSRREARAVIAARLAGFARGGAGVRVELADAYAALLNADVVPVIRSRGSVGAADLTALAEVAALVTGTGVALARHGSRDEDASVPALAALQEAGLAPVVLAPHEALAALSSNAYSLGVGSLALREAELLTDAADRAVALSLEALGATGSSGNPGPYGGTVLDAGAGSGARDSAAAIRAALEQSALLEPGRVFSVQDPLSFRTAPQLHGALRESVARLRFELDRELAARSENPLVDVESGRMISGGNFQALPLALAIENLRLAIAHVVAASERRSAALSLLLAPARREGRTRVPGLLLYAAADSAAEVRQLAAPATLASTTLSGVEDHSSFAPLALRLLARSLSLAGDVLAIEALHAADLLGVVGVAPTGAGTASVYSALAAEIGNGADADALVRSSVRLLGA